MRNSLRSACCCCQSDPSSPVHCRQGSAGGSKTPCCSPQRALHGHSNNRAVIRTSPVLTCSSPGHPWIPFIETSVLEQHQRDGEQTAPSRQSWQRLGTDGFSQSLRLVIITLIVFCSSFFIRVTFTYRKCLLKKRDNRKNPSALPSSLAGSLRAASPSIMILEIIQVRLTLSAHRAVALSEEIRTINHSEALTIPAGQDGPVPSGA